MNKALSSIQPSATLAIAARANRLKAEGKKVCNFSIGEPDFNTPEPAKAACMDSIAKNQTRYTPINGVAALCESIAKKLKAENGLSYDPSQIIVSCGAKHSLGNAFLALLNPGDEVIIPAPYWLSYPEMVRIAGGVPKFVHATEAAGLKITPEQLEAAITPKSVALIMNSPSNPTGMVYTAAELKALADVCVKRNLWIVSDEIYERMVYDGAAFASVGALSPEIFERTITVNGFSKSLAMTGWRIGYAAAPKAVITAMSTVQSHTSGPPATFVQHACAASPAACEADIQ
ncbi:MAG: pyridoxal phosphate-dependent aminotransferase, partial [Kiritimatiellaeota bacterium]|nr:pyridoxal phosphate-dependent aminotransferase [Kiritimatiellota bacterium]